MQLHPYTANSKTLPLAITPRAEDVIGLYQTLDPQQVLMRFAALAKHCLPLPPSGSMTRCSCAGEAAIPSAISPPTVQQWTACTTASKGP